MPRKPEEVEQPDHGVGEPVEEPPAIKRILYARLDRSIGWFEVEPAIHLGKGLNKGRGYLDPYGQGMIRAFDGDTGEPVWIRYTWDQLGAGRVQAGRLGYWQVTLDDAGKWFADNDENPHELWFEDRRRCNPLLAGSSDSTGTAPVSQGEKVPEDPKIGGPSAWAASERSPIDETTNGTAIMQPLRKGAAKWSIWTDCLRLG